MRVILNGEHAVKSVYENPQKVCDFSGNPYSTDEIHLRWGKSLTR